MIYYTRDYLFIYFLCEKCVCNWLWKQVPAYVQFGNLCAPVYLLCLCLCTCASKNPESSPRRERRPKLVETSRSCVRSSSWRRIWRVIWTGSLRQKTLTPTTRMRPMRRANATVSTFSQLCHLLLYTVLRCHNKCPSIQKTDQNCLCHIEEIAGAEIVLCGIVMRIILT